jgi:hypothetical protein
VQKIDPIIYTMKDNYYSIGERKETPFSIGKQYTV